MEELYSADIPQVSPKFSLLRMKMFEILRVKVNKAVGDRGLMGLHKESFKHFNLRQWEFMAQTWVFHQDAWATVKVSWVKYDEFTLGACQFYGLYHNKPGQWI